MVEASYIYGLVLLLFFFVYLHVDPSNTSSKAVFPVLVVGLVIVDGIGFQRQLISGA